MQTLTQNQELIDWLLKVKDEDILVEIRNIKHKATFSFDEAFAKGMTGEELKKRTTAFLKTLPWKK